MPRNQGDEIKKKNCQIVFFFFVLQLDTEDGTGAGYKSISQHPTQSPKSVPLISVSLIQAQLGIH